MADPAPALSGVLAEAVGAGVCSAAVAAISVRGRVVAEAAVGELVRYADDSGTLAADRPPVHQDSLFDLASITKLFTTCVVLGLVEEGRLDLDAPAADVLPEHYAGRRHITLRHLLSHTAGLQPTRRAYLEIPGASVEEQLDLIISTPITQPVGGPYLYTDVGMVTVGRIAELAGGAPLDVLVAERVTGPLGLADTGFRPSPATWERVAATECRPSGFVRGTVHDETASALGGVAGHAGIFSTAGEVLRFGEMLRLGGSPVLRASSVKEMLADQGATGAPFRQGLGVRLGDPAIVGPLHDGYGHSGFTGTALVVSPSRELTVVLLTNAVHPLRGRPGIRELRHAVSSLGAELSRA